MERKLEVVPAISDAIAIGVKNAASLVGAILLWVVTIWIPYLNVGTTIAINTLPGKLAKGEIINPLFIFESVYRRKMGDYFLLQGLLTMMYIPAFFFLIIPGIVLSLMYSLSVYIMLDKDETPMDALALSNKATYGFKWKIFGITLLFGIVIGLASWIIMAIVGLIDSSFISFIFMIAVIAIASSCGMALNAVIYRNLFLAPLEAPAAPAAEPEAEPAAE